MDISINILAALITSIATISIGLITLITNSYWSKKSSKQRFSIEFERYCQEDKEYLKNTDVVLSFLSKCKIDYVIQEEKIKQELEKLIQCEKELKKLREETPTKDKFEEIKHKFHQQIKLLEALTFVCNVWERCANAIRNEIYSEKIIYEVQSDSLIKIYKYFYGYIENSRDMSQNEDVYSDLEWLAIRWTIKRARRKTKRNKRLERAKIDGRKLILGLEEDIRKKGTIRSKIVLIRLNWNKKG